MSGGLGYGVKGLGSCMTLSVLSSHNFEGFEHIGSCKILSMHRVLHLEVHE